MKVLPVLIAAAMLPLYGCMNLSVPKTKITIVDAAGRPLGGIESPKDSEYNDVTLECVNQGPFTNSLKLKVGSVKTRMNPDVITTTGEAQAKMIKEIMVGTGTIAGQAAAGAAGKP